MTQSLVDSIRTAINIGLFPNEETATARHVLHTTQESIPIRLFKEGCVENINPARLSATPYPTADRPRGQANLLSVQHHRRTVRRRGRVESPIWIARKGSRMIMLDGVHRVVATYLEGKRTIPAYVVNLTAKRHSHRRRSQRRL